MNYIFRHIISIHRTLVVPIHIRNIYTITFITYYLTNLLLFSGAFLIPFTVMLIIAGLPLMFMELSFGQYAALGPVAVYNKFCPLFRGLGYGMVIVSSVVMLYYNLIIAWTIYYMAVSVSSLFSQLPWQNCDADWSTPCKCLQIRFCIHGYIY